MIYSDVSYSDVLNARCLLRLGTSTVYAPRQAVRLLRQSPDQRHPDCKQKCPSPVQFRSKLLRRTRSFVQDRQTAVQDRRGIVQEGWTSLQRW